MSAPAPPRGQRLPAPSRHAVLSGAGTLVLVGLAALALYQGVSGLELTLRSSLWQVVLVAGGLAWCAGAGLYALHLRALRSQARLREELHQQARDHHRQFLRRLDHELKNPLTAVRAAAADAASNAPGAISTNLEVIESQSRRMSRLLTDLRKLADLETAPLSVEDVDLAETVTDAVEAVTQEAQAHGGRAHVRLDLPQVPWPLPHVRGDGDLLYSAIYNLVSNAVKYTPPGGVVEVRGREDQGLVTIEVADTGIGVPPAEIETVFRELGRASNACGLPGSGLGLALARTIAERHCGLLGMSSRETVGTRVWLTLPVSGPRTSADDVA